MFFCFKQKYSKYLGWFKFSRLLVFTTSNVQCTGSTKTKNSHVQKQPLECSMKKGVLKIFAKYIGKHSGLQLF